MEKFFENAGTKGFSTIQDFNVFAGDRLLELVSKANKRRLNTKKAWEKLSSENLDPKVLMAEDKNSGPYRASVLRCAGVKNVNGTLLLKTDLGTKSKKTTRKKSKQKTRASRKPRTKGVLVYDGCDVTITKDNEEVATLKNVKKVTLELN